MVRAVYIDGAIQPLDPLPPDWREGQRLNIDAAAAGDTAESTDPQLWFDELQRLASEVPASDHQRMKESDDEQDRQAKEMMRRELGTNRQ